MAFIIHCKNKTITVKVDGELDLVTAHDFRESIDNAMEEMQGINLIIDLTKVSFIDSSGLGVILGRYRKIKSKNGQLVLCGMNPNVFRILELSGILSFIPNCKNEKEAWAIMERNAFKGA